MSVLKNKRGQSKAEFVNTARNIKAETRSFLSRLSARYARLDAPDIMRLAREVADCAEEANSILPVDKTRYRMRLEWLIQARAALSALDADLLDVYDTLMKNPEGAFSTAKGRTVTKQDAVERLDYMADSLGCLIADEEAMLTAVMKSDKQFLQKKQKEAGKEQKAEDDGNEDGAPALLSLGDRYLFAIGSGALSRDAISVDEFYKVMEEHDEKTAVKILLEKNKKYLGASL